MLPRRRRICKLIKKIERQEIEYYEQAINRPNTFRISRDDLYDTESESESEAVDSDIDIGDVMSGHESDSDLEEEPNNPISDNDE